MTSSIIDFLEARLEEDQAAAEAAHPDDVLYMLWCAALDAITVKDEGGSESDYIRRQDHALGAAKEALAIGDPARVLREIQAKRRVMARHKPGTYDYPKNSCGGCGSHQEWDQILPDVQDVNDCPELRDLAAIYSDHPEFRKEWAA